MGQDMKRVIAVANQKGGVGKTTTAVNLAASLTATKRRVLLIDLDPQGNATMGCGIDKHAQARTSCDVLLGECNMVEALVAVEYGGFMLLPSNQDLTAAEVRLLTMPAGREFKLRNALQPVREDFDVVLVDLERLGGGGFGDGSDAMRVLRAGGLDGLDADHRAHSRQHQSGSGNRGTAAHHVRPAQQSGH
jgi:MinD-like ATPase involved in chromosome partitioning or flagellar assembly